MSMRFFMDFQESYVEHMIIKMTGRSMVINVEYNQLDPLLRASGYPDGDVNSETGYSPFPGNINQVIFFILISVLSSSLPAVEFSFLIIYCVADLIVYLSALLSCHIGVSFQIIVHYVWKFEYWTFQALIAMF